MEVAIRLASRKIDDEVLFAALPTALFPRDLMDMGSRFDIEADATLLPLAHR